MSATGGASALATPARAPTAPPATTSAAPPRTPCLRRFALVMETVTFAQLLSGSNDGKILLTSPIVPLQRLCTLGGREPEYHRLADLTRPSPPPEQCPQRAFTSRENRFRRRPRKLQTVSDRDLAPGEWAVLALLCERPAHGWALARQLQENGEPGSIWSLTRPLVYRSLEILETRGMIVPAGSEPGARGPNRTIFRATPVGHAAVAEWLTEPVEHVREGRSLLLLKLVFAQRSCVDPRPMLYAQQEALEQSIASLEERIGSSAGTDAILLRFRLESSRGVVRFVDGILGELEPA